MLQAKTMTSTSAPTSEPSATAKRSNLSKEDREDLDAINGSIDRMRNMLPPVPYLLTIPQDVEPRYHHLYHLARYQWLDRAPFEEQETEHMQYQTWHYYEPGRSMYIQLPSNYREERLQNGGAIGKSRPATGANTPTAGTKKMSFNAYKKKQAGGTPLQEEAAMKSEQVVKPLAVKGPVERVKAETDDILAAVSEAEKEAEPPVLEKKELKRKRDDSVAEAEQKQEVTGEQPPPVSKKARTVSPPLPATAVAPAVKPVEPGVPVKSPEKPVKQEKTEVPKAAKSASKHSETHDKPAETQNMMPPRLSPLRDEPPNRRDDLPERLSPTLPANIAATLKARAHFRTSSASSDSLSAPNSASKKDGKLTPPITMSAAMKKSPRNGFRANSHSPAVNGAGRPIDEVAPRSRASSAAPPRVRTPEISRNDEISAAKPLTEKPTRSSSPKRAKSPDMQKQVKPSKIVRLKFKKHRRQDLKRVLAMPAKPCKDPTPQPPASIPTKTETSEPPPAKKAERRNGEKRDTNAKGVAQRIGPPPAGPPKKKEEMKRYEPPARRASVAEKTARPAEKERPPSANGLQDKAEDKPAVAVKRPPAANGSQKVPETTSSSAEKRPASANSLQKEPETKSGGAEKRSLPSEQIDAAQPAMRKKAPDALEIRKEPSTPAQPPLESPSIQSSAQKSQQITPSNARKDLLSAAAMRREQSQDSNINTPSARANTPTINGQTSSSLQANGISRAPSSQPSNKTPLQQAWETEQKRLETLGRELKHAAQAHLKASSPEPKLAAVKALESLLAYVLAFTCADEAALAADPKQPPSSRPWRSMAGYFGFVKHNCEPFPLLSGLASMLGMMFNARILALASQSSAEVQRNDLADVFALLQRSASDMDAKLNKDIIRQSFPQTWKQHTEGAARSASLTKPGEFTGEFTLPVGVQTAPYEAARAGYAMLCEWLAQQKLGYDMKLTLA